MYKHDSLFEDAFNRLGETMETKDPEPTSPTTRKVDAGRMRWMINKQV